jgi:WD40 repeat protein
MIPNSPNGSLIKIELMQTLRGHERSITDLAWDSDGLTLASASADNLIILWDPLSGKPCRFLEGHQREVLCLAWSHNKRYLASGGHDSVLVIWDHVNTTCWELKGHTRPIIKLTWANEQYSLASCSADHTIRVWDIQTRSEVFKIMSNDPICDIAWLSDDNILASYEDKAVICSLNRYTRNVTLYPVENSRVISGIYRMQNGNLIINPSRSPIDFNDLSLQKKLTRLLAQDNPIRSIHASPNHPLLAATSLCGTIQLWNTDTWKKTIISTNSKNHISRRPFAFHPRWPVFATLSDEDQVVQIWKANYRIVGR